MKEVVGLVEPVVVCGKKKVSAMAKFDTGAARTSIDLELAKKAELGPIIKHKKIHSALSPGQKRGVVKVKIHILGKTYETEATLSKREHSKCKVLIGRDIIYNNFVIDISKGGKPPEIV
ncbi:MAG: ATP-dependent zinc protease [Candidatus Diapherotrites archaeon]|nr:ATP-dependent zinc protease [Candidatus Diapherotrites archaeon]